ncbi:lysophospholipid acyltransferase family protein [Neomicrococcus aestuarii]|uniref:1-acyl-sn-glycerol-3-phosphate acyltransferase n=1 Tax=Neomicrococcus aestuarii TaxID=556325 RepID=A0A1L2ZLM8_9MICC|nr:lysophospholipid acyltransferase family protein [Neomicrococcus aestuarii]APF39918.1 1-acyl-sn-glycerol-3-phosphate acyltransferase [Neomicrococcus aestuarii]
MAESLKTRAVFGTLASIVRPAMAAIMAQKWTGFKDLPQGGFIACPNHTSEIDPLVVAVPLYVNGYLPRFLAKDSLFRVPVLGTFLRATGQIPVERTGLSANRSLKAARSVIDNSGAILIYTEGTLTRDPDLWPMRGKTGAARLALQTGAPVVPIVHWGTNEVMPRYAKKLNVFPRKTVRVHAGAPVDLSDLRDRPRTREILEEATSRITNALTRELAQLRGEEPPAVPWDPEKHGQAATGRGSFESAGTVTSGAEAAAVTESRQ